MLVYQGVWQWNQVSKGWSSYSWERFGILQRRNCRWSCGTDSRVRKKDGASPVRSSEWSDEMSIFYSWEMACKLGTQLIVDERLEESRGNQCSEDLIVAPMVPCLKFVQDALCSCSLIMAFPVSAMSYLPMHITKILQSTTPAYWWMTRSSKNCAQAVPSFWKDSCEQMAITILDIWLFTRLDLIRISIKPHQMTIISHSY